MTINYQRPISIENTCSAIYDEQILKEAIFWFTRRPIAQKKKVFMHGKYPAVSIGNYKLHIHRLICEHISGPLRRSDYVHHIDGNKLNNLTENLQIMDASEHQRMTNKGRKQSPEHVAKRADATTKTRYGHSIYEHPNLLKE